MNRRLSLQDVWHDGNQESSSLLENSKASSAPLEPRESHAFPKQFEQALQSAAQQQKQSKKRPLPVNRSRSNLRLQKLLKATRRATIYDTFDEEHFGQKQALLDDRRRPSLLALEIKPDEILIEEEEEDETSSQRLALAAWRSDVATAAASKVNSPRGEENRRDSGFDAGECNSMSMTMQIHPVSPPNYFGQEHVVW
jgi:hypothetical protein